MRYLIASAIVLSVLFFVSCSTKPGITIYLSRSSICYSPISIKTKRMLKCYQKRTMIASTSQFESSRFE
jgi:hypothetical protein